MPIYEYACEACGHRFEKLVRGSPPERCPRCAEPRLQRLVSGFAVAASASAITRLSAAQPGPALAPEACGSCDLAPGERADEV